MVPGKDRWGHLEQSCHPGGLEPIGRDWMSAKQSFSWLRAGDKRLCKVVSGKEQNLPDLILQLNFTVSLDGTRNCSKSFLCRNRLAD